MTERKSLVDALLSLVDSPQDPLINYHLALSYQKLGHLSSAASLFMRTAELASESNMPLVYQSLLRSGNIFERLGPRAKLAESVYWHAVSYMPKRPEAYFFLTRINFALGQFQQACHLSKVGFMIDDSFKDDLISEYLEESLDPYPGSFGFRFYEALSLESLGRKKESFNLLQTLSNTQKLNSYFQEQTQLALQRLQELGSSREV